MKTLRDILSFIDERGLYPEMKTVSSSPSPVVEIEQREMMMFCTNNYLNLASHPSVIRASVAATEKYGTGAGGSRLISGTTDLHVQLEKEISILKGKEDTLVYSSGYLANIGAITAISNPLAGVSRELSRPLLMKFRITTVVFSDELNHASIVDACKIANVECIHYRHADMDDLRKKMILHEGKRMIIITDGVFSMDGDIAPLPQIVELAKKYDAITIVDDAHGTGILGRNGGGTVEHFNLKGDVDVEIGTLNKVFGGVGGFVSGDSNLCRLLRITSRPYIFSAAMPPGVTAGLSAAVKLVREEPILRKRLFNNINHFHSLASQTSIPLANTSQTPIIPVIIGDENRTMLLSHELFDNGFFVPAVRWPAVPKGKARLRVTLMAEHTKEQIGAFINTLDRLCHHKKVLAA